MSAIADPSLAAAGQARIDWADAQMPVLRSITERFAREHPLAGVKVGACLHVTSETANLVRTLRAGGAEVALCAPNPLSTQDDVAAALVDRYDAEVHAINGEDMDAWAAHVVAVAAGEPQITLDDGADLVTALHAQGKPPGGATEETTTGLVRLRRLEAEGALECPVIAVNEAFTERAFNDRHGTGQSAIDGIVRATNLLLAGRTFVVIGYGWTGQGVALRAKGLGAQVVICEVDPLRALEAVMEGYQVLPVAEAARVGEVFVTVTGNRDALTVEHLEAMRPGAIVANAGHFDLEIDVAGLRQAATAATEVRPGAVAYQRPGDAGRVVVLAEGRLVGQACAEAHPAEVMDLTFATQALAVELLATTTDPLPAGVHPVPAAVDERVARHKLAAIGVRCDDLTAAQKGYLRGRRLGT